MLRSKKIGTICCLFYCLRSTNCKCMPLQLGGRLAGLQVYHIKLLVGFTEKENFMETRSYSRKEEEGRIERDRSARGKEGDRERTVLKMKKIRTISFGQSIIKLS